MIIKQFKDLYKVLFYYKQKSKLYNQRLSSLLFQQEKPMLTIEYQTQK
ncbi:hypothetical protein pb186bvf_020984 [Paramecium bursaria]